MVIRIYCKTNKTGLKWPQWANSNHPQKLHLCCHIYKVYCT